jgi:transposase
MKRKNFSLEFKHDAVRQAQQPGITKSHVAKSLGISVFTLSRWIKESHVVQNQQLATGISKAEYDRLYQELERVTTERNVLKQALSLFISDMK